MDLEKELIDLEKKLIDLEKRANVRVEWPHEVRDDNVSA